MFTRVLYQNIIIQLIARTLSPDIQLPLREHLVVFEPKVRLQFLLSASAASSLTCV